MRLREFQRRLARRVAMLRKQRGLTQAAFEEHGVSWKTVQLVEYGTTNPKASTLLKIATAFGMTLRELLDFEEEKKG